MAVFITGAPVEDNTASGCIRTVAATYGCVKSYNCIRIRSELQMAEPKNTSPCNAKDRRLSRQSPSALSGQYNETYNNKYFSEDKTIGRTPHTYSVAGYM